MPPTHSHPPALPLPPRPASIWQGWLWLAVNGPAPPPSFPICGPRGPALCAEGGPTFAFRDLFWCHGLPEMLDRTTFAAREFARADCERGSIRKPIKSVCRKNPWLRWWGKMMAGQQEFRAQLHIDCSGFHSQWIYLHTPPRV